LAYSIKVPRKLREGSFRASLVKVVCAKKFHIKAKWLILFD